MSDNTYVLWNSHTRGDDFHDGSKSDPVVCAENGCRHVRGAALLKFFYSLTPSRYFPWQSVYKEVARKWYIDLCQSVSECVDFCFACGEFRIVHEKCESAVPPCGEPDYGFFYHSGKKPEIVAVVEVVREAYPDHTAQDPKNRHFDEKATPEDPRWYMVDVKLEYCFDSPLPLEELKKETALEGMELLRRGSRLSVQPVEERFFKHILERARSKGCIPS